MKYDLSLICVYNNEEQYASLKKSCAASSRVIEFIGFDNRDGSWKSAAAAYNRGVEIASSSFLLFSHQDIRFTDDSFIDTFLNEIRDNPNQVIGVAGAVLTNNGHGRDMLSGMYQGSKLQRHHTASRKMPVMTLDECLFGCSRSVFERISFDDSVCNGWHFYAVDFCLQAQLADIPVCVVPANVLHLSGGNRDASYYLAQEKIKEKYKGRFKSIATTCGWTLTDSIDPYRPIVVDEVAALYAAGCSIDFNFYLPLERSLALNNKLFFPSLDSLKKANGIQHIECDSSFFESLGGAGPFDMMLLHFVVSFNNYIASRTWLYEDLLDLKRDYAADVANELENSKRYKLGHFLLPWSSVPTAEALNASADLSTDQQISLPKQPIDNFDFSILDSASAEEFSLLLQNALNSVDETIVGYVGDYCALLISSWLNEKFVFDDLCRRRSELQAVEDQADSIRSAFEASFAFKLGSLISRIAG